VFPVLVLFVALGGAFFNRGPVASTPALYVLFFVHFRNKIAEAFGQVMLLEEANSASHQAHIELRRLEVLSIQTQRPLHLGSRLHRAHLAETLTILHVEFHFVVLHVRKAAAHFRL